MNPNVNLQTSIVQGSQNNFLASGINFNNNKGTMDVKYTSSVNSKNNSVFNIQNQQEYNKKPLIQLRTEDYLRYGENPDAISNHVAKSNMQMYLNKSNSQNQNNGQFNINSPGNNLIQTQSNNWNNNSPPNNQLSNNGNSLFNSMNNGTTAPLSMNTGSLFNNNISNNGQTIGTGISNGMFNNQTMGLNQQMPNQNSNNSLFGSPPNNSTLISNFKPQAPSLFNGINTTQSTNGSTTPLFGQNPLQGSTTPSPFNSQSTPTQSLFSGVNSNQNSTNQGLFNNSNNANQSIFGNTNNQQNINSTSTLFQNGSVLNTNSNLLNNNATMKQNDLFNQNNNNQLNSFNQNQAMAPNLVNSNQNNQLLNPNQGMIYNTIGNLSKGPFALYCFPLDSNNINSNHMKVINEMTGNLDIDNKISMSSQLNKKNEYKSTL